MVMRSENATLRNSNKNESLSLLQEARVSRYCSLLLNSVICSIKMISVSVGSIMDEKVV